MRLFRAIFGSDGPSASRATVLLGLLTLSLALLGACASPSGGPRSAAVTRGVPETPYVIKVQSGESLSILAERHNVPMSALAQANGISRPYTIYTGQKLTVPAPRTHRVKSGDTLSEIALAYGTSTSDLAKLNGKSAPYTIYRGERLRVGGWTPDGGAGEPRRSAPAKSSTQVATASVKSSTPGVRPRAKPQLPTPPARSGRFLWPAEGRILSTYGPKSGGLHNDGINIKVPAGTPVVAADNGVVAYAGNELKGYGNLVLVRHQDGFVTAYAHNSQLMVKRGDIVTRGQQLAKSGSSGGVTSPQVHFEVRRGSKAIDPMTYLGNNVASR